LPFREGTYIITGDARVTFNSRGSGTAYSHDLVSYPQPSFKIDYGWYSVFFDFRLARDLKIKPAPKFGYTTSNSIQRTYLESVAAKLAATKTGASLMGGLPSAWTPEDTKMFVAAVTHCD